MTNVNRLRIAWKAFRELGPGQLLQYFFYQLSLRSGLLRWQTPPGQISAEETTGIKPSFHPLIPLPNKDQIAEQLQDHAAAVLAEADEICAGRVRLFGGDPMPLQLIPKAPLAHWTRFRHRPPGDGPDDIKLIWEPGRFGWAVILARAYYLSQEPRYAQSFWTHTETFLEANPPNLGPHWVSAQEVALRLIALSFALQVFHNCPVTTPARLGLLLQALADHARRIPPSLTYARAQGNNHLLSEAAGLYTASLMLPAHPAAPRWQSLGWQWFHQGLLDQIAPDGTYVQQSANYHRLMLQLAVWVAALAREHGQIFPAESRSRLALATRWLNALIDPASGETPNLGPNDGALILPLASCPRRDFRPTLAAAGAAFLEEPLYPSGPWQEMGLWLRGQKVSEPQPGKKAGLNLTLPGPAVLQNRGSDSWGYLRAVNFTRRPGHADQLHFDLWWRGVNLALDPGTYHYNASPPWENSLSKTDVHNTLSFNEQDQMTRAGRFLWLDWAQAEVISAAADRIVARHDGYQRFRVIHQRAVAALDNGGWLVEDEIQPLGPTQSAAQQLRGRLHWLLPDWAWECKPDENGVRLSLQGPPGQVQLSIQTSTQTPPEVTLARAGERIFGTGPVQPHWGWRAPTYAHKTPALSFAVSHTGRAPFRFVTAWQLNPA